MRKTHSRVLLALAVIAAATALAPVASSSLGWPARTAVADTDSVFLRASDEALARMTPCKVTEVIDGDTIRCEGLGRVRLLLIDTPERDQQPWGERARAALQALIPEQSEVRLESDVQPRDQYGRLLAYVYRLDGSQVNELMVYNGFAEVVVYPPNVRHVDVLRRARTAAREARRGLWSTEAFECAPRAHRSGACE
jgi:endonuclease YncB( thermonuclease family)